MCELNNKPGLASRLFQEPGIKINLSLKQGVDKYCFIDNFKHSAEIFTFSRRGINTICGYRKGRPQSIHFHYRNAIAQRL
jgi:hypothetical protein